MDNTAISRDQTFSFIPFLTKRFSFEVQNKDSFLDVGIYPKCGYQNDPENNFCEQCGVKLE